MENKLSRELPSTPDISLFRSKVVRWFNKNKRNYPWRETHDPFKVLIAEMMLRRTKADQVKAVYDQLFAEYPDVETMAKAGNKELEQILYPLGLKWRIPAFGLVAREVKEKYQCKIPEAREELTTLPGVGEYVAGAVLSIAYGKKEWIVDSNIVRLFRRYFGIKTSKEGRRDKHVVEIAKIYISVKDPRKANLALLDFAALICLPRDPRCSQCPLSSACHYPSLERNRNLG
jgi:A/G-specific adenine glycosylase